MVLLVAHWSLGGKPEVTVQVDDLSSSSSSSSSSSTTCTSVVATAVADIQVVAEPVKDNDGSARMIELCGCLNPGSLQRVVQHLSATFKVEEMFVPQQLVV
jgi:hypothetical protein